MPKYNQCSKRYLENQENQLSGWHLLQGQRGHKGKHHPLSGCHSKQLQPQKLILAAKPPGVSSWRKHNVLQGTKPAETRNKGLRDIKMKELGSTNERGYSAFILVSSVPQYLKINPVKHLCHHSWKLHIPTGRYEEHLYLESVVWLCWIVLHET